MIDLNQQNTLSPDLLNPPLPIVKHLRPLHHKVSEAQSTLGKRLFHQGSQPFHKTATYTISKDLIRIFLTAADSTKKTELIFPRQYLHAFQVTDHETLLDYRKKGFPHLRLSIQPLALKVLTSFVTDTNINRKKEAKQEKIAPLRLSYKLTKKSSILFSKYIETSWDLAQSMKLQKNKPTPKVMAYTTSSTPLVPTASKPLSAEKKMSAEKKSSQKPTLNLPSPDHNARQPLSVSAAIASGNTSHLTSPAAKTSPKANKVKRTKLALFTPRKLLNKQLLPTELHKLKANTNQQKIFDYFLTAKKKKILQKVTPRIKEGTTLSLLYPDYRNFTLFKKKSAYQEQQIKPNLVQSGYYVWQENNKIITSPSTKLMPLRVAETILQKHIPHKASYPIEAYLKQLNGTYQVAMAQPFALDQKSLRRLRKLLRRARIELKSNKSNMALSPAEYGQTLTHLRSWVTYDFLKKFSVKRFQRYFKNVERIQGRGKYAHLQFTKILGLFDTGRIQANRNFLNHYHYAIKKAAKKYPRVPQEWIEHIIWIETKGDPRAISHAGAYGLMQLLPDVFLGMGSKHAAYHQLGFKDSINPFNPEQNIERGTAFLESLLDYLDPVIKTYPLKTKKKIVFHAYNRGPTKVKQLVKDYGLGYEAYLPRETRLYLSRLGDYPL